MHVNTSILFNQLAIMMDMNSKVIITKIKNLLLDVSSIQIIYKCI